MEQKDNVKREGQRERLSTILQQLAPDVTTEDRAEAVKACKVDKATISRYLAGDVRNLDTAIKLLQFFRVRIQKREKAIGQ
jgi:hypothetical protein